MGRITLAVCNDQDLTGACDHIDGNHSENLLFGFRHKSISGTDNFIHLGHRLGTVSQSRHCLGTANLKNLIHTGNLCRCQDHRIDLSICTGRSHHDDQRAACNFGRDGVHQNGGRIGCGTTGNVNTYLFNGLNADTGVHGVLLFRPLPDHLRSREREICNRLLPEKDVDGMTDLSAAGVYTGQALGFPPCTAAACMEILDHYGIDCKGKNAVVIGRSLVVGKPAAMMLMAKNATVTICHTRTVNTAEICKNADIIVTAAGVLNSLTKDFVREGQIVIDVSMNWNPEKITTKGKGGMSGDCIFDEVEPIVEAITPVPGGVGAVTTSVLMKHVVEAAEKV